MPLPSHVVPGRHRSATWVTGLLDLEPAWRDRVLALRDRVETRLRDGRRRRPVRLHGDLSADQVLVDDADVSLIDLDRAGLGAPETDLGSFLAAAHLDDQHDLVLPFLEGYAHAGGTYDRDALAAWQAISLVRRAVEPFRRREPEWPWRCAAILTTAEQVLP